MQYRGLIAVLIGISALCMTACRTSRKVATNEQREFRVECSEFRDSSKVESLVVLDTLREVTTITITENEVGDTLRLSKVTERDRIRDRAQVKEKERKVVVKTDTVFVAVRDSTDIRSYEPSEVRSRASPFVSSLKCIFWIIVGLIAYKLTAYVIGRRVF